MSDDIEKKWLDDEAESLVHDVRSTTILGKLKEQARKELAERQSAADGESKEQK